MSTNSPDELTDLAVRLGHSFTDPALLERALSHRSWCAENGNAVSNERLEFLGDAVLGWVIADLAYHRFADLPEGRLTDLRKSVVNAGALAEVARGLGIGPYIRLGNGESAAGGAQKPSILSDAFEAILGAIYLDAGAEVAHGFVERHVGTRLSDSLGHLHELDYKTTLQERCAARGLDTPVYELTSVGPDHAKVFTARVSVGDHVSGVGEGRSKKAAEQVAAAAACERLAVDA